MANNRLKLDAKLKEILGTNNVYYQTPGNEAMKYPAIKYDLYNIQNDHANNEVYAQKRFYTVMVIDQMPDTNVVEAISKLPTARFDRQYKSDGLNHTVFIIYY